MHILPAGSKFERISKGVKKATTDFRRTLNRKTGRRYRRRNWSLSHEDLRNAGSARPSEQPKEGNARNHKDIH
jgi:hypothetical protein